MLKSFRVYNRYSQSGQAHFACSVTDLASVSFCVNIFFCFGYQHSINDTQTNVIIVLLNFFFIISMSSDLLFSPVTPVESSFVRGWRWGTSTFGTRCMKGTWGPVALQRRRTSSRLWHVLRSRGF